MGYMCGGKIIYQFSILYLDWELDNVGWVIQKPDKSRSLILTSHGSPYEASIGEIEDKIKEYKKVLKETEAAIEILKEKI